MAVDELVADAVTLVDGTPVAVRPMRAEDGPALDRFHHSLSPGTVYLRFFSFHPELTPDEIDRFTHVDHRDREALVAVVAGEIIAVARFDRMLGTDDAEVAFVVGDAYQGQGLGQALFGQLADRARRLGISRLVAQTLPHNQRMRGVFRHCGLPVTSRLRDGVVEIEIDLTPLEMVPSPIWPGSNDPATGVPGERTVDA